MHSFSRNQPCPCGSGKKYKHCCASQTTQSPRSPNPAHLIDFAVSLHNQGRLKQAETQYRRILADQPDHADALHLLGLTRHQQGYSSEAAQLISSALAQQPHNPVYLNNLGEVCRKLGLYEKALDHFRQAILHNKDLPQAHLNLGRTLIDLNKPDAAIQHLRLTVKCFPNYLDAFTVFAEVLFKQKAHTEALAVIDLGLNSMPLEPVLLCLKGICLRADGQTDTALHHYKSAIASHPNVAELHHNLGLLLQQLGQHEEAAASYARELAIQPNPSTQHILDALRGVTTERAPANYVRETFDAYADNFDSHLIGKLHYHTPERLAELLNPEWQNFRVLDLGCGTGLMCPHLRNLARRLVGLDLSPRMIDKAQTLQCYDQLIVGDLIDWLNSSGEETFNLVVAADVLNYLGNLSPVLSSITHRLEPHGHILFSVESADQNCPQYHLDSTGRYRHNPEHICQLASLNGLRVIHRKSSVLRREKEIDVQGELFLLQKAS